MKKLIKNISILVLSIMLLITSVPAFAEESTDDIKQDIKQYLQIVDQIDPSLNPTYLNIIKEGIKSASKNYEKESDEEKLDDIRSAVRTNILNYLFYRISMLRGTEVFDEANDKSTIEDKELYDLVSEFKKGDKPYKDTKEIFDLIQGLIREQAALMDRNSSKLNLSANEINLKTREFYEKTNKIVELIKKANATTNRSTVVPFDELEENKTYLANIMSYHTVRDQKSMSDAAIGEIAKLIKKSDGKIYIQIEMNPIAISMYDAWFSGYLLELRHIKDFDKRAKDKENFEKANCLKYYDYTDELCEKYGKDMKYPKILEFPYETKNYKRYWGKRYPNLAENKFKNTIPAQVEVFVPIMQEFTDVADISNYTGDPDDINAAYKFDFEQDDRDGMGSQYAILNIFSDSIEEYKEGDKATVETTLTKAKAINETNNNKEAYKDLQKIISEVESNLDRLIFTKDDENDYISKLNAAMSKCNKTSEENLEVPIKLWHGYQNKPSMGNGALVQKAKITEENGKTYMTIKFKALRKKINGLDLIGHLEKLWIYENNNFDSNAKEVTDVTKVKEIGLDGTVKEYPSLLKFEIDPELATKDGEICVKVFVDAMEFIGKGMGTQNAKILVNGSQAKAWTGWGDEDQPTPTPTPTPTPNVPSREDVVDALKRYANLGGPQYTYQSNMMYVNAYNSLMSLLTKPNATDMQVKFAIDNLKAAAAGLTLDTSKPNNSGNNQGWGNNNQGWGNNNQGWGNNSGWGNNNQGWGNNNQGWGNNNQGWGNNNQNNQNNGPVTVQYEVPVEVLHAHQSGYSMANAAINHTARVEERDGKFRYSVNFHAIQRDFGGKTLTGNLTNLFIIDGSKYRADQSGNTWSWTMNGKYDRVNIAVWVDAMDEIAGKGPGGGEQNAILSFNWNNAREVGRVGGNNNNQNQQNQNQQNQQKQQNQNQQAVQNNNTNNFTDTSGHWAKTAIDYVVSKGYFAGLSNTEFGPNKSITRGQFVSVLGRMLNVNVNDYKDQNFKDVKSGMYYSPYITWANKVGIASGVGQGNFAPDKELTREEMAVMMTKFLKVSGKNLNAKGKTNAFKDEDKIQGWAKDSVKEMARLGIVSGMGDGNFAPKSSFTRAQVAQVLYNIDHN